MFNFLLFTLVFKMVSQFKEYLFSVVKLYLKTLIRNLHLPTIVERYSQEPGILLTAVSIGTG